MTDLIIVGAGAAGLMAAVTAAQRGLKTLVLDPQRQVGTKLRITGKGRCNVTSAREVRAFLEFVPRNPKFLQSSLYRFQPKDTMAFFEGLNVPLKVERGERVFPVSDRAGDVADALERAARRAGAEFIRKRVSRISVSDGQVNGVVNDQDEFLPCRAVLLCTGGLSYPATGSTGDGYRMAAMLGHKIVKPRASLIPLLADDFCAELEGLSLRNVTLSVFNASGKLIYRELGEMLFTHFGVSGPLVLSASSYMTELNEGERYRLSIDLKPGLDEKKLDERVLRDFAKYANRDFRNALDDLLPRKLIPVIISRSGIPDNKKVNALTRAERRVLVTVIHDFPLEVYGTRPIEEAIVTAGGVDVSGVNPRTMESRIVRGLYFAGEILDVDACTGGYNLQIAWSTGRAAALAVPEED